MENIFHRQAVREKAKGLSLFLQAKQAEASQKGEG